jgi:inhibitor of cysteine peptidase
MLLLTQPDHGRTVAVHVNDTVQITLPESASTGFRWAVERLDDKIVEHLPTQSHYPAAGVGSAGEVAFNFRARKAGQGEILLRLGRSWEGEASVSERFRVILDVRP